MDMSPATGTTLPELDAETRAALTARRDAPGVIRAAFHFGAIGLCGAGIAADVALWPLLIVVQGVLIAFLFTLEHEATHGTPFRNQRLNEWAGHLAGAANLVPFLWFRYFHLAHHRHTNLPDKDPELDAPKPATRLGWAWHVSGLPFWWANIRLLGRLARGEERPDYLPSRARRRAEREARVLLGLYAVALASLLVSPVLFWVWILPALIGQPALRVYLLAEHGDCPQVASILDNTRTTLTNQLVRLIAWNMPYHVEHHAYPNVPFHALPRLHRRMRDALRVTAPGYAAFTRRYLSRRPWRAS
ncbi:fatty acid desaturase [Pseudooceanicola atlanticus]|uniref:fatty acid desaturase n=2 Tax=Pseudooceanicola atlanticus TaxID=1461694 RepID=UPI000B0F133A|nr:fatty acid desaturase [Pseudooceanicola atlanticus]